MVLHRDRIRTFIQKPIIQVGRKIALGLIVVLCAAGIAQSQEVGHQTIWNNSPSLPESQFGNTSSKLEEEIPLDVSLDFSNTIYTDYGTRPIHYWFYVDSTSDVSFSSSRLPVLSSGNILMRLHVPEGVEVIGGEDDWQGTDLDHKITTKLRFPSLGQYEIEARAKHEDSGFQTSVFAIVNVVDLNISALELGEKPEVRISNIELHDPSLDRGEPTIEGTALVHGIVTTYPYDNGRHYMLRGIKVELWEDIPALPDAKLGTVYTVEPTSASNCGMDKDDNYYTPSDGWTHIDNSGYFDFGFFEVGSSKDLYIKVIFEFHAGSDGISEGGTEKFVVRDDDTILDPIIEVEADRFTISSGETSFRWLSMSPLGTGGTLDDEAAHAFFDISQMYGYFRDCASYTPGHVNVKIDMNDLGSPSSSGSTINLNGWNNSYLTYEKTASIVHEYAHSVHWLMRGGNFPPYSPGDSNHGGCANTTSADGLTEGWARFVPARYFNDHIYRWAPGVDEWDISSNYGSNYRCDKDEWTVGAILWDLWTELGARNDTGFYIISKTLENHDPDYVQDYFDDYIADWGNCAQVWQIFINHNVAYPNQCDYVLTVGTLGTGSGTVESSPSGINCPSDCNESYIYDTTVTLTVSSTDPGSTFSEWGGACSGTAPCVVTMSSDKSVNAIFTTVGSPGAFSKSSPADEAIGQPTNPMLSWETSSDADNYEYCYDTTNDDACDGSWYSTTSTIAVLGGLSPGTTYYWQVCALNEVDPTCANSETWWSFTTQVNPPGAFSKSLPTDGENDLPNDLTLSWGLSSGATSYEYCYDTTNNNSCDGTWRPTGTNRSKELVGLSSSTTYYWQVRATNAADTTYANSDTWWSFTTQDPIPYAFGKSLPPDEETNQPTSLTLSWSSSSGATSYEYCYDTTDDDACDGDWEPNSSSLSVGISGLSDGTTYYWQVRARNAVGTNEADSYTWWSFTTAGLPGAFSKILPIDGAPAQPTSPTLDWSGSSDATSYEYCYDTTDDDACDGSWIDTGSMISSVGLSGLTEGTTYYWQVRAQNALGPTYADDNGPWWSFTVAPSSTATLTAIKDVYAVDGVGWGDPDTNYNGQTKMGAGVESNTTMKSALEYDLSSIPSNATILDAYVQLRASSRTSSEPLPVVSAYQVTSSWGESTLTWNSFPTFNASPIVTETIDSMTTVLSLTSLAQTWLDNPSQNLGIMLQRTSGNGYVYWFTREYTSNPDWQPKLVVTYSEPGFCESVSEIPTAECEALEAFYNSTDGDNWTDNTGWLATITPCSWYGVTCSGGQVTKLELMANNLNGSIPPQIVNLTALEELWLRDDLLVDDLEELGSLANLTYLSIIYSQISGTIPLELCGLSNLVHLDLHGNQLTGEIPSEIGNLTSLTFLWLGGNQLTGDIPEELGNLTSLEQLWLWGNQLSGNIPPELGDLSNLLVLELGMNRLTGGIPSEIGNLTNLVVLGLSSNALSGEVPTSIVNLTSLDLWFPIGSPDFGYNMLTATDPAVKAFLDAEDPDWSDTQTVAPIDVHVINSTTSSVELSWTPIPYSGDGGYYEVSYSSNPGGPYTVHGTTVGKTAIGYTVDGLNPGNLYYFVVKSYTPTHSYQQNELRSSYSQEISGDTLPAGYSVYLPLVLK